MKTTFPLRSSISSSRTAAGLFIVLGLACLALSPQAHAVSPAPDGSYSGANTAEGNAALFSLTTGGNNTALGSEALFSVTAGNQNTATGAQALKNNTADGNTADGFQALVKNTTGGQNTGTGWRALFSHITGNGNTAVGAGALFSDATGQVNTAVGAGALFTVNNGFNGSFNTAVGFDALYSNTGGDNTAVGFAALGEIGSNMTGHDNTAVGVSALPNTTTGSYNIALGGFAGQSVTTASHVICIGSQGGNIDKSCWIAQIFNATAAGGSAVFIDSNDRLGTVTSSKRFKEDVKAMDKASEALFALEPVKFHYKKEIDPAGRSQFGLVAEDVEKVNPDLVVRDKEGKPYSVRYDQVNAMLLNEFLKEHRRVEEQSAMIAKQQKQIEALTSALQKVSAQLELNKSAPRTVANNQ